MQILISRLNRMFVLACTLLVCHQFVVAAPAAKPSRAAPVVVAEAQMQLLAPITWVAGTVISRNDARLATEVDGRLKKVAEVGTRVSEDQVIARIDSTFVDLRIEEHKSAVGREKAQLEFLREEVKRLKSLARQNNAAKTRLEQTVSEREIARNNLNIARTRLQQAREEKMRHMVRAPFAGVIAERFVQGGERVEQGDQVVRLIDANSMEVQARVPLNSINYVHEESIVSIRLNDSDPLIISGRVRVIVPVGDERSRLMDLRVNFEGANWRIGQPVRVSLPTAAPKEVLAIPRDALVLRRSGTSVYKVNGSNKAENVPVKIGIASGNLVEVSGDLQSGDKVVIRGSERLRPGQDVKIISK